VKALIQETVHFAENVRFGQTRPSPLRRIGHEYRSLKFLNNKHIPGFAGRKRRSAVIEWKYRF
jgi:hypothetical protein